MINSHRIRNEKNGFIDLAILKRKSEARNYICDYRDYE